ncbi:MAG TPA: hypothetical protein VMN78_07015 [Longimicrobiales bacterium]|nr:hypothetical protein [Longimicrobiales bacterium]
MISNQRMRASKLGCLLLALGAALAPARASAQAIRVTAESENFRAQPRGEIIAFVPRGAVLEDATRDGGWYRATLRGWIWSASVESAGREARLIVRRETGENLRAEPNGEIVARASRGTVLTELERSERWARVERVGWIWAASVEPATDQPIGRDVATPARAEPSAPPIGAAAAAPRPTAARIVAENWLRAGRGGVVLLQSPDGDTLGSVRPMTAMEVVAREGNWARVRVDGWVWQPGLASAADSGVVLSDITAAVLAANPENFRGRTVEWRLQFIALERAERIRSDFYEGEPFILARGPGDEAAFVYVAVPPDKVAQVERIGPLEWIVVLGRVRTGRSRVMGAPVLDLLELRTE